MPPLVRFRNLTRGKIQLVYEPQLLALEAFMMAHMREVIQEVAPYPAVPPNSRYQRTGVLGQGWKIRINRSPSQLEGIVYNDAKDPRGRMYATYVQGPGQVWYHARTGWKRAGEFAHHAEFIRGSRAILAGMRIMG